MSCADEPNDSLSDIDADIASFVRGFGLGRRGTPRTELPIGAAIGEHLGVIRRLGAGATGVVYLARDHRLQRDVAVKVVEVHSRTAEIRVEREAQAMARVVHPNVLVVHEIGRFSGGLYIAMEYVDGHTLRGWLSATERSWSEIVDVLVQCARGLHAAHRAGLSHRDFKPANVLVGRDGRVRVADFGLARPLHELDVQERTASEDDARPRDSAATTDGLSGTPTYMAPERVLQTGDGPLADQFSFGVAMYEALCEERPYRRDVWTATAADLRRPASRLPSWLRDVMIRTVALDASARFADVGVVADRLQRGSRRSTRVRLGVAVVSLAVTTAMLGLAVGSRMSETEVAAACVAASVDEGWAAE